MTKVATSMKRVNKDISFIGKKCRYRSADFEKPADNNPQFANLLANTC